MEWKHLQIPNGETTIFCNAYITEKSAMNIIVTHTPIVSTVDFKNTAGIGYSYPVVKVMSSLLTLLPNFHITVKPPKYVGYNDRKDNSFYEMLARSNPNMFKNSTKIMNTLLEYFVSPDSA